VPRWNTETLVAGVDFSQCRATILDGPNFATIYAGSTVIAGDGTPHTQRVNRGVKGLKFGTSMPFAPAAQINAARTAIEATEAAQEPFHVRLVNALYEIDVWAIVDYDQQWLAHGEESEGIIENLVMRFVALSVYTP
jgi:hypothetical protein